MASNSFDEWAEEMDRYFQEFMREVVIYAVPSYDGTTDLIKVCGGEVVGVWAYRRDNGQPIESRMFKWSDTVRSTYQNQFIQYGERYFDEILHAVAVAGWTRDDDGREFGLWWTDLP